MEFRYCADRFDASQVIEYVDHVIACEQPGCDGMVRVWEPFLQIRVPIEPRRAREITALLNEYWRGPADGPVPGSERAIEIGAGE